MGFKRDIARAVADEYSLTYKLGNKIVNSVIDQIVSEIKSNRHFVLGGFGSFWPEIISAHDKFSHITKQSHPIPAGRRVKFRPADSLKRL
jgi:nucleoid DNA-binding protein